LIIAVTSGVQLKADSFLGLGAVLAVTLGVSTITYDTAPLLDEGATQRAALNFPRFEAGAGKPAAKFSIIFYDG
jgi:hypothetical protein